MKNVFALYQDHIGSTVGFIDDKLRGVMITVGRKGQKWGIVATHTENPDSLFEEYDTEQDVIQAFWQIVNLCGNSKDAPPRLMKVFVEAEGMLEKERALSVN